MHILRIHEIADAGIGLVGWSRCKKQKCQQYGSPHNPVEYSPEMFTVLKYGILSGFLKEARFQVIQPGMIRQMIHNLTSFQHIDYNPVDLKKQDNDTF
jgi:hypothetical protein